MTMSASSTSRDSMIDRAARPEAARFLVPVGRLCFALIFLLAVPMHFTSAGIGHAAQQGVPAANLLVPISGIMALLGGLSVLFGYYARFGAALLAIFLIPVTLMMHKFWGLADPGQAQIQQIMFMKNVAILGGAFLLMYFGAGPFSLDARSPSSTR
jgi:putative oxidoreductase